MRTIQMGLVAAVAFGAAVAGPAWAISDLYPTQQDAMDHCQSPVVWLNLGDQKYFVPGQAGFGQGSGGGYACLSQVKGDYFESKESSATTTTTVTTEQTR